MAAINIQKYIGSLDYSYCEKGLKRLPELNIYIQEILIMIVLYINLIIYII